MSTHVTHADCPHCGGEYEIVATFESADGQVDISEVEASRFCRYCGHSPLMVDEDALAEEIVEREREQAAALRDAAHDRAYDRMVEGG